MDLKNGVAKLSISPQQQQQQKKQQQKKDLKQQPASKCPIADTSLLPDFKVQPECPFHKQRHQKALNASNSDKEKIYEIDELLLNIGGGDKIRQMCTRFYAHAFEDQTLSKFMFVNDCAAAHGQRLGDWIIERMGGEGAPWTDSGRYGGRQHSHFRAWNSAKRPEEDRGKRFKLDDCRIWMRLMFWSMKEVGLDKNPNFTNWFVAVIERFIGVYERSAPPYTKKDFRWSEKRKNIDTYVSNDFLMKDIAGKGRN